MRIFTILRAINVPIHFRMTLLEGFIKWMHKQKVTNLGSRKLHLPKSSDKYGVYNWPKN